VIDGGAERAQPPQNIFDISQTPTWCTYFEDAELASQLGDWERVAEIGDIAYALEDDAEELTEHFVFIDGYLRGGQVQKAWDLSQMLSQRSQNVYNQALCDLWNTVEDETQGAYEPNFREAFCSGN